MRNKPLYMISVVSEILEIHPQTLRQYERLELLKPSRTLGNTRLYSDEDIEKLRFILTLTRDMGVNLAGVEIILKMRDQINELQNNMEQLVKYINDTKKSGTATGGALVPKGNSQIIKIKIEKED